MANKKRISDGCPETLRFSRPASDHARHHVDGPARRVEGTRSGPAPRRPRSLPGGHVPLGAQPRQGHALPVDAESLPRLHARLSLLLRSTLPDAVRARAGRRVLVAHFRETQLPRCPASRAREAVVDARVGCPRYRHRPVSTDRGPLQAHTTLARGADSCTYACRARDEGTDGRARRGSARRARTSRSLHGTHQRADGLRGGVGRARAWHGASVAAPARGSGATKGGRQRGSADGANRPGLHDRASASRGHNPRRGRA